MAANGSVWRFLKSKSFSLRLFSSPGCSRQPARFLGTVSTRRSRHQSTSTSENMTETGKVDVNGVQLYYERRGAGPHPVLCIPGALGTAVSDFAPQLEYFGRKDSGYTVVAYDPRGYGNSRPPSRTFHTEPEHFLKSDAYDAYNLMKVLGFSDFSVFGWSDGGVSAIVLAAKFQNAVKKLVVWGASAYISREDLKMFEAVRDVSEWSPKMRESLEAVYGSDLPKIWAGWNDSMMEIYTKTASNSESLGGDLCIGELPHIKCPTLILHGEKDPLCPQFHAEYLRDHITGSKLHLYPTGKHNIHLRFAQEFNALVDQFLKE